jgi:hypothetical protein
MMSVQLNFTVNTGSSTSTLYSPILTTQIDVNNYISRMSQVGKEISELYPDCVWTITLVRV